MEKASQALHPYHYREDKSPIQHIIDWIIPVGLFLFYFFFYNFGEFTPSEMIKTTGLVAISLLSITLGVGPASRFIPSFNILKAHRKFWGVSSFLFALSHGLLVIAFYMNFSLLGLIDINSTRFLGLFTGLLAILILSIITLSSNKKVIQYLQPQMWKRLQTTSYLALFLAVSHFYLMEQQSGILVIKRFLGKITFWFATVVILVRFPVFLLPKKES